MAGQIRVFKRKRGDISVRKTGPHEYEAKSESRGETWYRITFVLGRWFCGCKHFAHTSRACKHVVGMKNVWEPSTPAAPGPRAPRSRRRRKRAIGMPAIECICGSTSITTSHKRHNKYYDVQVYKCRRCGRRFTPNDGFRGRTYRGDVIIPAIEDRACCKKPRDIRDSRRKTGRSPALSTLHTWFTYYPRMVTPYLMSLDFYMSPIMYTDEIIVKIKGVNHVIFTTTDGGTRMSTGHQVGRKKGSHNVTGLFRMDRDVRGAVPAVVRSDGANNFASAHELVFRNNDEGVTSMHIRHIHLDGDMNTNLKERDNDTLKEFVKSCRGLKKPDTAYIGLFQTHFNVARSHSGIGDKRPMEAAGVYFEHPNKWLALISNAAHYNSAVRRGAIKPARATSPLQSGFQVVR